MKNIHLTDEEVQQYALNADACPDTWHAHVQHCDYCQAQVMTYQLLFEGIETQQKAVFDFNLEELVMEQLPKPEAKTANDKPFIYTIALAVVIMIGVAGYVFGSNLIGLFAYLQPVLVGLLMIASCGVMVFLGIDMYQKYKAQMKTLNFY